MDMPMDVPAEVRDRDGGLVLEMDATAPLRDLTAALGRVNRWVDGRPESPVVVLRLNGPRSPVRRAWPTGVTVQDVNRWERALRGLEKMDAVSIMAADGICGGPAFDLLLAADYRISTPGARFLLPVNDGHMWPGLAIHRLVQQIGIAAARRLVLWGHELPALRAHQMSLVDEITDDLQGTVRAAVLLLGRLSGPESAVRRQLLHEAAVTSHEEALGAHLAAADRELRRLAAGGDGVEP